MVREQRWNWPLWLLEKVLHGLHLLEVARHICGQHHLYHQSPQLPGRGIRHEEKLTAICCKGNITSSSCLDDRLHNQSWFNFSSRMRDDFLSDLHAEVTSLLIHYISTGKFCSPSLSHSSLQLSVSFSGCLCVSVTLTSSHLWRGCRGCSFHRRPAEGGTQHWRGGSPTLSGHCTGWLCLICPREEQKSHTAQINRTFVVITCILTSPVIMIYKVKLYLMAPGKPERQGTEINNYCGLIPMNVFKTVKKTNKQPNAVSNAILMLRIRILYHSLLTTFVYWLDEDRAVAQPRQK